jgi:hypothetical protein
MYPTLIREIVMSAFPHLNPIASEPPSVCLVRLLVLILLAFRVFCCDPPAGLSN